VETCASNSRFPRHNLYFPPRLREQIKTIDVCLESKNGGMDVALSEHSFRSDDGALGSYWGPEAWLWEVGDSSCSFLPIVDG
jgi:hypothetical protein